MPNRREFIKSLFALVVVSQVPIDIVSEPLSLLGIPYHETNATAGTWLGIERSTYPQFYGGFRGGGKGLLQLEQVRQWLERIKNS